MEERSKTKHASLLSMLLLLHISKNSEMHLPARHWRVHFWNMMSQGKSLLFSGSWSRIIIRAVQKVLCKKQAEVERGLTSLLIPVGSAHLLKKSCTLLTLSKQRRNWCITLFCSVAWAICSFSETISWILQALLPWNALEVCYNWTDDG